MANVARGRLMLHLLQGHAMPLSLGQVFDSTVLTGFDARATEFDGLLRLFEVGAVRWVPTRIRGVESPMDALVRALDLGQAGGHEFEFSAWPELPAWHGLAISANEVERRKGWRRATCEAAMRLRCGTGGVAGLVPSSVEERLRAFAELDRVVHAHRAGLRSDGPMWAVPHAGPMPSLWHVLREVRSRFLDPASGLAITIASVCGRVREGENGRSAFHLALRTLGHEDSDLASTDPRPGLDRQRARHQCASMVDEVYVHRVALSVGARPQSSRRDPLVADLIGRVLIGEDTAALHVVDGWVPEDTPWATWSEVAELWSAYAPGQDRFRFGALRDELVSSYGNWKAPSGVYYAILGGRMVAELAINTVGATLDPSAGVLSDLADDFALWLTGRASRNDQLERFRVAVGGELDVSL